jgi:glycosyltransferase involved in cell wall biosynthesis
MKLIVVTNIPNPYRIPLFNVLNKQVNSQGDELLVLFGSRGYDARKFKLDLNDCEFNYKILNSVKFGIKKQKKTIFTYGRLLRTIIKERPDKVIINSYTLGTMKLFVYSLLTGLKFIVWSGSIANDWKKYSFLRIFQRKMILKRATGCLAYGNLAKQYFESLGCAPSNISIAINTVDVSHFKTVTEYHRKAIDTDSTKKHLTYIGYLSLRKNVKEILIIIKKLFSERNDFVLDIIGDGNQRSSLEEFVRHNKLESAVKFHGFKQKNELAPFLAKSSIFLFQTDFDVWGLVLNEAMAAGITCISSVNAGATHDLIENGKTGFAVDYKDHEKVIEIIQFLLDNPEENKRIGEIASELIHSKVTLVKSAEGFINAMKF